MIMSDSDSPLPDPTSAVSTAFHHLCGRPPAGVWSAPGRVNIIGEHTDYNDGYVLPFALPQRVTLAAAGRGDDRWTVHSLTTGESSEFTADDLHPGMSGWQTYLAGVVWALREAGYRAGGADLVLTSDVPIGAGLSSSAALECATLTALADLYGLTIAGLDRAKLARRAENEFVGAPTGLMDQAASTLCTRGNALFFDCRTYAAEQVPFDLNGVGLELLVLDTKTKHTHVDSEYATRRRSCDEAARMLGVQALRDVATQDLQDALTRLGDDEMRRRVSHVVTEDQRVLDAVAVLRKGRLRDLGPLLDASHASMRDNFEITVPTVDLAVRTAKSAGALGARMTGGGFGGCIIALTERGQGTQTAAAVETAFGAAGFDPPTHFLAEPSPGAGRLA